MRIFVSYRREDTKPASRLIYERLCNRFGKENVFFDVESVPPATDFRARIAQQLSISSVVLAVVGQGWTRGESILANDDFIRMEIEAALALGLPIVPVYVDGARPPATASVPLSLVPFLGLQGLPLDTGLDFESNMRDVIGVLERGSSTSAKRHASDDSLHTWQEHVARAVGFMAAWAALATFLGLLFFFAGKPMDERRQTGAIAFSGLVAATVTGALWYRRNRKGPKTA